MHNLFPSSFCVSGTDTDVGKTVISAILLAGLGGTYWKPIQCGKDLTTELTDRQSIQTWTGKGNEHFLPETYFFDQYCAPHLAAELSNTVIDHTLVQKPQALVHSPLIVETTGGLLVPMNDEAYMIDIIKQLDLPVLLVARSGLGTINHTLLNIALLHRKRIQILGVVMNGPKNEENKKAIQRFGKINHIFEVELLADISPVILEKTFSESFATVMSP